jgi:hypothetical protein
LICTALFSDRHGEREREREREAERGRERETDREKERQRPRDRQIETGKTDVEQIVASVRGVEKTAANLLL